MIGLYNTIDYYDVLNKRAAGTRFPRSRDSQRDLRIAFFLFNSHEDISFFSSHS